MNHLRLRRFALRATAETLRNSPASSHLPTFFSLAQQRGMVVARTWLLGRLILDESPETDPTPEVADPHPRLDSSLRRAQHANRTNTVRQQEVKSQSQQTRSSIYSDTSRLG